MHLQRNREFESRRAVLQSTPVRWLFARLALSSCTPRAATCCASARASASSAPSPPNCREGPTSPPPEAQRPRLIIASKARASVARQPPSPVHAETARHHNDLRRDDDNSDLVFSRILCLLPRCVLRPDVVATPPSIRHHIGFSLLTPASRKERPAVSF